ncbi:MAG: MerR family transcriptional regulator [Myxococcales bacterium]|nr:MerR family transcriptional regulator [Myxococcales bacterium]
MTSKSMNIGRFARLTRLSIKALRLYDEQALLSPAEVDPRTGYRSYRREQVKDAVIIAMLRALDVPLERVRALLDAQRAGQSRELSTLLADERARVERQLRRAQRSLRSLDALLVDGATLLPCDVALRDEPRRVLATLRSECDSEALEEHTYSMIASLSEALARAGAPLRDPVGSVIPLVARSETLELEVFSTLDAEAGPYDARALAAAGVSVRAIEAHTCAMTLHTGPYESLALAHHALLAWVSERAYGEPSDVREHYIDDPRTTDEAQLRTEVLVAITAA